MASSAASLPARTVRSAFLIGQHTYEHDKFANLEFAGNDVRELAQVLGVDCGFKVERLMDAKKADFADLPNRFARSLEGCADSIFLLYYAGHGLCCKGQPYLVPVDAAERDAESCVNLYGLIRTVHDVAEGACRNTRRRAAEASSSAEAPGSVLLIVLDNCREWPKSSAEAHWEELSITEAKPPRAVTTEVSILFACDEGQFARENTDVRHGFFTAAFLRALKCPDLTWREVCLRSREGCLKDSRGLQRPWILDSSSHKSDGLVLHPRKEREVDSGHGRDPNVMVVASRGGEVVLPEGDTCIPLEMGWVCGASGVAHRAEAACDEGQDARENETMRVGLLLGALRRAFACTWLGWYESRTDRYRQSPRTHETLQRSEGSEGRRSHAQEVANVSSERRPHPIVHLVTSRGHDIVLLGRHAILTVTVCFMESFVLALFAFVLLYLILVLGVFVCLFADGKDVNMARVLWLGEILLLTGTPWILCLAKLESAPDLKSFFIPECLHRLYKGWPCFVCLISNVFTCGWCRIFNVLLTPETLHAFIVPFAVLAMAKRWALVAAPRSPSHSPRRVQLFKWVEGLDAWSELPGQKMWVLVSAKWLPFWLMQGLASFLLLETVWNMPRLFDEYGLLRVLLRIFLAAAAGCPFHRFWLSKVGLHKIHDWHLIDAMLSSILASQCMCCLFLSFDPSKWYRTYGSPPVHPGYDTFTTVVPMSMMALWPRDYVTRVASEQSVEVVPSSHEPLTV